MQTKPFALQMIISKTQKQRKYLTLILIFLMTIMTVEAQNYELGAIGGFNIANVVGKDTNANGNKLGIHLGGYIHVPIIYEWGFRTEALLFSQKGTSSDKFRTTYIDIPLMATYKFNRKFMAMAGFQPSILYLASIDNGSERQKVTSDLNTVDLGIIFGGTYQLSDKFHVGVRFVPGLSKIYKEGDLRAYNFTSQIFVGYRLMKHYRNKKRCCD